MHVTLAEYEATPALDVDWVLELAKVEDDVIAAKRKAAEHR